MPLLSVIIPCYNVAEYIESAVYSVLASGIDDMEIFLIDDGSSDTTPEICRDLAERYPNIIVLYQNNAGPGAARNAALSLARGEWLTFIDADDIVVSEGLASLLNLAINKKGEIVQGDYYNFSGNPRAALSKISAKVKAQTQPVIIEMTGKEAVEKSLYQVIEKGGSPDFGINNSPWGKIYHRSLFKDIRFPVGIIYEDLAIFYRIALKARKVILTSIPVYLYRQNPQSITHTFNRKRLDVLSVTAGIENYVAKHHPELLPAARDRRFAANYNMYRLMNTSTQRSEYTGDIEETYKYIRSNAREILRNPRSRRKNRIGAILALFLPSIILRHM